MDKNIVVLFNNGHNEISKYIEYYFSLKNAFNKKNMELFAVFTDEYDYQTKKLNLYNIKENKIEFLKKSKDIDLVLYRSTQVTYTVRDIEDNYNFLNPTKYNLLSTSKTQTVRVLKEYSAVTHHFSKIKKDKKLLEDFSGEHIILKPEDWHWGKWVERVKLNDFKNNFDIFFEEKSNYLAQEFLDMSDWIDWLVDWPHDLRFMLFWKELDCPILRVPKKWDFRANVVSWWKMYFIKKEQIPENIINLAQKIANQLTDDFWELFASIDFAQTKNRWLTLIELNNSSGVINIDSSGKYNFSIHERIATFVKDFLN